MKPTNFSLSSRIVGDVAVIYPKGYLNNITGENLVEECSGLIGKGITKIVLNLRDVEFINSIGISMLLTILERLKESSGSLCFTDSKKMFRDTFEMLGLTVFVHVFASEDEAFQHLASGGRA